MENKTSFFDIAFSVIISILWVVLGIVSIASLNPTSPLYLSAVFCFSCLFFLPVAAVALAAWMSRD